MAHQQPSTEPARTRAVPEPPRLRRYQCTNCGLILELANPARAACKECGHTRLRAADDSSA